MFRMTQQAFSNVSAAAPTLPVRPRRVLSRSCPPYRAPVRAGPLPGGIGNLARRSGAHDRDRTGDPFLTKEVLYH